MSFVAIAVLPATEVSRLLGELNTSWGSVLIATPHHASKDAYLASLISAAVHAERIYIRSLQSGASGSISFNLFRESLETLSRVASSGTLSPDLNITLVSALRSLAEALNSVHEAEIKYRGRFIGSS